MAPRDADNPFGTSPGGEEDRTARRSSDPDRAPDRSPATRSAQRIRAITVIANVLSRAEVSEYEIAPLEEIPEKWRAYDAIWRAGKTVGLVRLYRNVSAKERREVYSRIVAGDFERCEGSYQSGVKRQRGPGRAISFFSRCLGDEEWSLHYVVVGSDKAGYTYLVGLYSPDRNEPLALGIKLRDALSAIVLDRPDKPKTDADETLR